MSEKIPTLNAIYLVDNATRISCHIEKSIKFTTAIHNHDYFEIFIIVSGMCIHNVNGEKQLLESGDMVFIRPEDTHCYTQYKNYDCRFLNVSFFKSEARKVFEYYDGAQTAFISDSLKTPPVVRLKGGEFDFMVKKAEQILMFNSTDKQKSRALGQSFLADAMFYFYCDYQSGKHKSAQWFDKLLLDIRKDENFVLGVDRLYELSGKSPGYISRVFKNKLNMTPTEYINLLKLEQAQKLLIKTRLPILDISIEAGFDNLSHFYHLFKKEYGISPAKFRESLAN